MLIDIEDYEPYDDIELRGLIDNNADKSHTNSQYASKIHTNNISDISDYENNIAQKLLKYAKFENMVLVYMTMFLYGLKLTWNIMMLMYI